jgi:asparagine synthetase B (glutamine-hydrolysing)
VWTSPNFTIISTLLTYVTRLAPERPVIDPLPNAIWSTGWTIFPDGRTFFRSVRAIERGNAITLDDGHESSEPYWDPRPDHLGWPSANQREEHSSRLRTLLLKHLSDELDPGGRNVLSLSGGVDSSCLAALAAGRARRKISTISLVPDREPFLTDERRYLDVLDDLYGFESRWEFPFTLNERLRLLHQTPDVTFPVIHPILGAAVEVQRQQEVAMLFGGEFADEVCGSVFTIPDWIRHTGPLRLAASVNRWPDRRLGTLRRWISQRAGNAIGRPYFPYPEALPEWVRLDVNEEYVHWRQHRRAELRREPPLAYLALNAEADGFVAMNWESLSVLGIRRSWPFFHREVLEFAFECHPSERIGPGIKKLLRQGLAADVPPENLNRSSRGSWPTRPETLPVPQIGHLFDATFDTSKLTEIPNNQRPWNLFWGWVFAGFEDQITKIEAQRLGKPGIC